MNNWANQLVGATSGIGVDSTTTGRLNVALPSITVPADVGAAISTSLSDAGTFTGSADLRSVQVDRDGHTEVGGDLILDNMDYQTAAQDTNKLKYTPGILVNSWTSKFLVTNSSNLTAANIGSVVESYTTYPVVYPNVLSTEFIAGFTSQPVTNAFIEFGVGLANTVLLAPADGAFFRITSGSISCVVSYQGTETIVDMPLSNGTGLWVYNVQDKYRFTIDISSKGVDFYVEHASFAKRKAAFIATDPGNHRPIASSSVQVFMKQRHNVSVAPATAISAIFGGYSVRMIGNVLGDTLGLQGNRLFNIPGLFSYANSTAPTAFVPTNTTNASGINAIEGQFLETDTLAVGTDGIVVNYQNPSPALGVAAKRLVITRITINSYISTGLTGGGYVAQWSLAYGHTAVSLATTTAASTKAPRRKPLGIQVVGAGAAAFTSLPTVDLGLLTYPIYVNPGEFFQIVKKKAGVAPTLGAILHMVSCEYTFE